MLNLWVKLILQIQQSLLDAVEMFTTSQQTRGIQKMMFQCWTSVEDGGATLKQHWVGLIIFMPSYIYKYLFVLAKSAPLNQTL